MARGRAPGVAAVSPRAFARRAARGAVLAIVTVLLACVCRAARAETISYETRVTVVGNAALKPKLLDVSRLRRLEGQPPPSMVALRRRIERDLKTFSELLRSEGYYDHAIRYRLDTDPPPLKVRIRVDTGPAYHLTSFDIMLRSDDLEAAVEAVARAQKDLAIGERGQAERVVNTEDAVLRELARSGFPFPRRADREVAVDHADRSMAVRTVIDTGRRARFGVTTVEGVEGPLADFAKRRVPWKTGDLYDPEALEKLRKRLGATGVFASVRVSTAGEVLADDTLPVVLSLERGKVRSVGASVGYSSSEGVGGRVFWEHRDLSRHADRLRIGAEASQIGESGRLTFRRPDFLATDQDLIFETSYEVKDTQAYNARIFSTSIGLERPLGEHWTGRAGMALQTGPVDESTRSSDYVVLVGLPLGVRRDSSDSILDPTKGMKLDLGLTPYLKELGSESSFAVGQVGETAYVSLLDRGRLVLAGRAAIGSIVGAGQFVVPADRRFYAGGGGSVRGFGYQMAGPLNEDRDPEGGRSLIELNAEVRWKITKSFGVVPFLDGGSAFADEYPSLGRNLFWGAGLGFRYFSPVGPIRLDVATPLNPRRGGVDDPVQFYISLGQAY